MLDQRLARPLPEPRADGDPTSLLMAIGHDLSADLGWPREPHDLDGQAALPEGATLRYTALDEDRVQVELTFDDETAIAEMRRR